MSDDEDEDVDAGEEGWEEEEEEDMFAMFRGMPMGYERTTSSMERIKNTMVLQRENRKAEVEREKQMDPGLRAEGGAELVKHLLRQHYGSLVQGWRECLDLRNHHKVGAQDFFKVLTELGYSGDKKEAWVQFTDKRPCLTMADFDTKAAKLFSQFWSAYTEEIGKVTEMVAHTDGLRMSLDQFLKHNQILTKRAERGKSRKFPLDLKATFRKLAWKGHGYVSKEDCQWLNDYCSRGLNSSMGGSGLQPDIKRDKNRLQDSEENRRSRDYAATALVNQRTRALTDLRTLLHHRFGSIGQAWRRLLDREANGVCDQETFFASCEAIKFKEGEKAWEALTGKDCEKSEDDVITLQKLEPRLKAALNEFKEKAAAHYGSLASCFRQFCDEPQPLVGKEEFIAVCKLIKLKGNPRLALDMLDQQGVGKVLLSEIDAAAADTVFGEEACEAAVEEFQELEPDRKKKARPTLAEITAEQMRATKRAPEDHRSLRLLLIQLLERRFQSPLRGWSQALDLEGKGKMKKDEFYVACAKVGFTASISKLWEELGLKPTSSVRLKDIAPEAIAECKLFKACCGGSLGKILTALEADAPARNKKIGVKIDVEKMADICKEVKFTGDPARILVHLDAKGDGFVTSKALRFFNEEKKEEKAVTALVNKRKKDREKAWAAKLESMRVAPTKELLTVQDKMLQTSRSEKAKKNESDKTKEQLLRSITGKYPSIARCWRLALNPESKSGLAPDEWIEGLVRAEVLSEDSKDEEIEKYEELYWDIVGKAKEMQYRHLDKEWPKVMWQLRVKCQELYGGTMEGLLQAFMSYDPEFTGFMSADDFRHMMHSIQLTEYLPKLLIYLDPNKSGKVELHFLMNKDLKKDYKQIAEHLGKWKKEKEKKKKKTDSDDEEEESSEEEPEEPPSPRTLARTQKREEASGQKKLVEWKKRLIKKHNSLVRVWRDILDIEGASKVAYGAFESAFEARSSWGGDCEAIWSAMVPEGLKGQLTLELLDPNCASDMRDFRKKLVERWGSTAVCFEEIDCTGLFTLDHARYLDVCYEAKFKGNEKRLFSYLDKKDEGKISLASIDRVAVRQVQQKREEEELRRHPEKRKKKRSDSDSESGSTPKSSKSEPKSPKKGKKVSTLALFDPKPAKTTVSAFRDLLRRRFGGNALRAFRALDPDCRGALNRKDFAVGVRIVGFGGSDTVLFNNLLGGAAVEPQLVTVREIDPEVWKTFVDWKKTVEESDMTLSSWWEDLDTKELTKKLTLKAFTKNCEFHGVTQPEQLFEQLDVKQTGSLAWEGVSWLEDHWNWEEELEVPIRQEAKARALSEKLMGRTFGQGPLAMWMSPTKVKLAKSNSLPALSKPSRPMWNERHSVNGHSGNKDMNTIYEASLNTSEREYIQKFVARGMLQQTTVEWMNENAERYLPNDVASDSEDEDED